MRDAISDYMVSFEYNSGNSVKKFKEHAGQTNDNGGEDGAVVTITRTLGTKTTYKSWGNDRIENNDDDLLTTYLFDEFGHTVNVYTTSNSGEFIGASNAAFTHTDETNKKNNRTLFSAEIGKAAMSFLADGGFESISNSEWWLESPSGGETTMSYNELPRTGRCALKIVSTSTVTEPFGAYSLIEAMEPGCYTASAYVNTSGVTSFGGDGVFLKITDNQGNEYQSENLNYATSTNIDGGWARLSVTFQVSPTNNNENNAYTLHLRVAGAVGTIYIDDVQVEQAEAPSKVNLIDNGGLNSCFRGWTTYRLGAVEEDESCKATGIAAIQGTNALKLEGDFVSDTMIYQEVPVNLPGTETYVLSGWAKANAVPDNVTTATGEDAPEQDTNKQFGLRAILTYHDNTVEYHYVPFNPEITEWQFASLAVVPKETEKTVSKIKVVCAYEENANTAYFDNLSLVREAAQSYQYDNDGNLTVVRASGVEETTASYTNNDMTQFVSAGEKTFNYSYDNKHNLKTAQNAYVKETYTLNSVGNVTTTTLTKATGASSTSPRTTVSTDYSSDNNRAVKTTAANGAETTFTYGSNISKMQGTPTKTTDAAGTETTTVYRKDGLVQQSYISSCIALNRTYDAKNRLTRLLRGGYNGNDGVQYHQRYNFTYDDFGNVTKISIGTASPYTTLGQYTYAPKNGLLTKMTYGNGNIVNYTYDSLGRKKQVTTSSGDSYNYQYSGDGQLYEMTDLSGGLIYRYTYDTVGRLIGSFMKSGNNTALQTWQQYDANNKLTRQDWVMPGASYYTRYFYDSNGRLTQQRHTLPTGNTSQSLAYDELNRVTKLATTKYRRLYQYKDGPSNYTTTGMVSQLTLETTAGENGFATKTFNYTYDILGNIKKISGSGGTWTYTYDNQSQLTKAVHSSKGTWNYSYDTFGNIRSKSHGNDSIIYTYGNSNWRDLLTAVSGSKSGASFTGSYTYDGGGNPTSYYNVGDLASWTMTWKNGRELATASKTGTSISYDYDVNGLRTQKTVNGITHTYTYASGKLLRDAWTEGGVTRKLDFFYDPNGHAYVIFYQKGNSRARFYCLINLQGDVIGLLNTSSQLVAEYSYDAYGNLLTKTNYGASGLASEICDLNPLRYRGYYFDQETGFYYLQSRYYDPALGRFINADSYASTGQGFLGYNMFAYCGNNPLDRADPTGSKMVIVDDFYSGIIGMVYRLFSRLVITMCLSAITDDKLSVSNKNIHIEQMSDNPTHPVGTEVVRDIINSDKTVYVSTFWSPMPFGSTTTPAEYDYGTTPQDCRVRFDCTQSESLGAADYPGYIIMAHELIHAYHMINGTFDWSAAEEQAIGIDPYSSAIFTENAIRKERGLSDRPFYEIGGVK